MNKGNILTDQACSIKIFHIIKKIPSITNKKWLSSASFATPSLALCKNYEICKLALRNVFYAWDQSGEIPSRKDGLISPARVADQSTGFASCYPHALPVM